MEKNDHRHAHDPSDRRRIPDEVEIEFLVESCVYGVGYSGQKQGMPVRRSIDDRFGADVAARTGTVLNHEWLPESLRKPLAYQARRDVDPAAGGKADDDAHRPRRIGLCARNARESRHHNSAHGHMQKLTTGMDHLAASPLKAGRCPEWEPDSIFKVVEP